MFFRLHAANKTVNFILENATKNSSDNCTFALRQPNKRTVVRDGWKKCQQLGV